MNVSLVDASARCSAFASGAVTSTMAPDPVVAPSNGLTYIGGAAMAKAGGKSSDSPRTFFSLPKIFEV
jgi:hypothetical protein